MNHIIDLRSDTVTRPTATMRQAMARAEVGDDVYGDDPTVNRLQAMAAERLGFEAALFTASGTQANLIAMLSHCGRGDEYIVGQRAHTYRSEGGGAAVLGSIQPQPVDNRADGTMDPVAVEQAVKPDNIHYARTRLICMENTISGKVLPMSNLQQMREVADRHSLALHLDGARIFNAAVKMGVEAKAISAPFDSVAFCLSKGLGAPMGSILCGTRELIKEAVRWRKMTGGGMRQIGVVAAAGIIALDDHVARLAQDHEHAQRLASALAALPGISVDLEHVQTNMLFLTAQSMPAAELSARLLERGIHTSAGAPMRLVTHLDVSSEDIDRVIEQFTAVLG